MRIVLVVEPPRDHAVGHGVAEGGVLYLADDRLILFGQDVEGGLSVILVPDGDLARDDVRQGVDKQRRAGIELLWRYGGKVLAVIV